MTIESLRRIVAALDSAPRGLEYCLPRHQSDPQTKLREAEERLLVLEARLRVYEAVEASHEAGNPVDFDAIASSAGLAPAPR